VTYDQLILEAQRRYAKYLEARKGAEDLSRLLDEMKDDFGLES